MSDDEKTDYEAEGFQEDGDGSVWGSTNPGKGFDASGYDSWNWKQIMAAITGGAAVVVDDPARREDIVSPKSLYTAAWAFSFVQQTMTRVADSVLEQANALAGENGPWQGPAAKEFRNLMEKLSVQIRARAEQISGGDAKVNPIPQQLWNNGVQLDWAQKQIHAIDHWYANEARRSGADLTEDGLVIVSSRPEIEKMMTDDMRRVLKILAGPYDVAVNDVRTPDTSYLDGPGDLDNNPYGFDLPPDGNSPYRFVAPAGDVPPYEEPPPYEVPPYEVPPYETPPYDVAATEPPPFDAAAYEEPPPYDAAPYDGSSGATDPYDAASYGEVPPYETAPYDQSQPNALSPDGYSPEQFTYPDQPDPTAFDPVEGAPVGDLPETGVLSPYVPGFSGTGGSGAPGGAKVPDRYPGGAGSGAGDLPDLGVPGGTADAFPGASQPVDWAADGASNGAAAQDQDGLGAPMSPMMPPMGGGSPGGAGGSGDAERPDSSGLLGGEVEPWSGGGVGVGDPGGVSAVAGDPADWASGDLSDVDGAGSGAPMSPMMPPMGGGSPGGAGGSGDAERPDSSGLLGGDVEPWSGDGSVVGEPGGMSAVAGDPADWASSGSSGVDDSVAPALPMSPMMPPAGAGAPGGGASNAAERPDSSGLLGGAVEPWVGDGSVVGEPGGVSAVAGDPAAWAANGSSGVAPVLPVVPPIGGASKADRDVAARPGSAGLLGGDSTPWTGDSPTTEHPDNTRSAEDDPPDNRIAVVRPSDEEEDTSAWDAVAGAGMAGFLVPLATTPARDDDEQASQADYTLRDTVPWQDEPSGEKAALRRAKGGQLVMAERPLLSCSGAPAPEPEEEPEEETEPEDEEEDERTAADLLRQNDDAWGRAGRGGTGAAGVLE